MEEPFDGDPSSPDEADLRPSSLAGAGVSEEQFPAAPRRITMVFDPLAAGVPGLTLSAADDAAHGAVEPRGAVVVDGYTYTSRSTAREAEEEIAAWHDLLHGPP